MRILRRRRPEPAPFPDEWRRILARRLAPWSTLDATERARLEELVVGLLAHKRWTASHDFELTAEVMVTVAGHAALLVLGEGLGLECYRDLTSIEVHASSILVRGEQPSHVDGVLFDGVTELAGRADERGPVFLAWDEVRADARHPRRGRNVVFHEFAHALDMLDGRVDGTPLLAPADVARWVEVCLAEYEALRAGDDGGGGDDGLLDGYGAQNPAEFFAVATEAFFTRPAALRDAKPELYGVLAAFYRQDPAARAVSG